MDSASICISLQCTEERAKYLRALAEFQTIPSIGPKSAQEVIDLEFFSLEEIKNEEGADLINRLESLYGFWEDPCVEDTLRCIVHHANHRDSGKSWWDFTEERKKYRIQYGYPSTRPQTPWYEKKVKLSKT
ncbi:helix-hairpin-helix domain-containing protein [Cytobacillus sp. Hz8]|uniref:helix-hairpin-helix domain-containing protein n=1 Tax=Cytobacillus sp. Hz8 TaxID=3347168 RepID=UPI0035E09C9C